MNVPLLIHSLATLSSGGEIIGDVPKQSPQMLLAVL
jgi:hypothetical protein